LTRFSSGLVVYSHNQLYGKWFVCPAGEPPQTRRQLRFAVHTAETSALLYSASDIEVLDEVGLETQRYLARLGPDLLSPDVVVADVVERLKSGAFARRQLGHLLLDQGCLAGVGNYLRSEILYRARVHPAQRPCDLSDATLDRLASTALELSRRSFRTGGVTNDAERVARMKKRGKPRSEYRFLVFARAGERCYRCRQTIVRSDVGSRRLFWCPRCQPANP
jgi:endonuclease-8